MLIYVNLCFVVDGLSKWRGRDLPVHIGTNLYNRFDCDEANKRRYWNGKEYISSSTHTSQ